MCAQPASHTLFNPTPCASMRDLSTDRPDQTESPYTVDAGHLQVEMDVVSATFDRNRSGGVDTRTAIWNLAPVNLKIGLLDRVDLHVMLDTWVRTSVEVPSAGLTERASGFGGVITRVKVNLWGNDGGRTALAVMPFMKWPQSASGVRPGRAEGGLIVPFAVRLADRWDLGAMTEVDVVAGPAGRYGVAVVHSLTLGRRLTRRFGVYAEAVAATVPHQRHRWQGQVDVGWTYTLRDDVRLDGGANVGVAGGAPAVNPFVGMTLRF